MKTAAPDIHRSAIISDDGLYRYRLARSWDASAEPLAFVMLNPSTADALVDDPTIRRCRSFAAAHGFGGIVVANLFAFRATNPKALGGAVDPVGPDNDDHLRQLSHIVVCAAWGAYKADARVEEVKALVGTKALFSLGETASGAPRHPLYVAGSTRLQPWGRS